MGLFVDYTSAPRSLRNFKHDHNAFLPELLSKNKMYHYFASTSLAIVEERNFGIPQGKERHFVRQVGEEKIELIAYMARKQRI